MFALESVSRLLRRDSPPRSIRNAAQILERDSRRLAAMTNRIGLVVGACLFVSALVLGRPVLLLVALGGGYLATVLARGAVAVVANARRSRALGTAPALVSRAVLQTRIAPSPERAAVFAAETDGWLGERLAERVRTNRGTPQSGLNAFAAEWREPFPALHRALTLVVAAADAPRDERNRTLDRAMDAILDGTRDRAADAAESLHGPATAVYAFGVLLPLALVGVLPAAGAAGVSTTLPAVIVIYDLLLPIGLLGASGWLLAKRPVAFPPSPIEEATGTAWRSGAVGMIAGTISWITAGFVLPAWTRFLAAVGFGVGTALVVQYQPAVAVRERARTLETDLSDALYLVGRRAADGIAVERAVADAASELDGVAGDAFQAAARRQQQLRVDIETAFTGEYGALEAVASPRAESAARLLGTAADAGPPAGRALVETATHLDSLQRVERDARRELGRVTGTLGNTGAFFAPLVGGTTVALAGAIGTVESLDGSVPPTAGLGTAVGLYVLFLAVILTTLSTGLSRGLDRTTVGYRVGVASCTATATFLVALHLAGTLAGGL